MMLVEIYHSTLCGEFDGNQMQPDFKTKKTIYRVHVCVANIKFNLAAPSARGLVRGWNIPRGSTSDIS